MALDINKWVGTGRLVKDAELRFIPNSGSAVLDFTMALSDDYKDTQKSYFIPVKVYGKAAENLSQFMVKGIQVAVSGKITTRSYDAKDGTKKYVTEIQADNYGGVKLLGGKKKETPEDVFNQAGVPFETDEELGTPIDDDTMPF